MRQPVLVILALLLWAVSGNAHALVVQWDDLDGGNDHYYELVEDSLTWEDARDAAATRSFLGLSGYLVTITSAAENQFLVDHFTLNHHWIGAFQFDKLAEPDGHWRWVTDEPFLYTNWNQVPPHFEPNESGVEDWAAFGTPILAPDGTDLEGKWQDWKFFGDAPHDPPLWYFVEYDPSSSVSESVIPEPPTVWLLGLGILCFLSRSSSCSPVAKSQS